MALFSWLLSLFSTKQFWFNVVDVPPPIKKVIEIKTQDGWVTKAWIEDNICYLYDSNGRSKQIIDDKILKWRYL